VPTAEPWLTGAVIYCFQDIFPHTHGLAGIFRKYSEMRVILIGAPGTGKGTQARQLVSRFKTPQISTGDLLRRAVDDNTALGKQAKPYMDAGQLVPDEIVLGLLRERLSMPDAKKGFVLDGFPRNLSQAETLDEMLDEIGRPLQAVIHMEVDYDLLMQRLAGRRTCVSCGQLYNVYTTPPKMFDRCDKCGGKLRHRADDNEETIGNRLRVYETQTAPLIDYYRDRNKLQTVQGEGEVADIARAVSAIVSLLPKDTPKPKRKKPTVTFADLERKVLESVRTARGKEATKKKTKKKATKKKVTKKKVTKKKATKKKATKKKVAKKKVAKKKVAKKKVAKKAAKKKVAKKKPAKKKPARKKTASKRKR